MWEWGVKKPKLNRNGRGEYSRWHHQEQRVSVKSKAFKGKRKKETRKKEIPKGTSYNFQTEAVPKNTDPQTDFPPPPKKMQKWDSYNK